MTRDYCICPIGPDGLLYVETPNFEALRTLLIQQRFRGQAHFRTVQGYVPYSGGGIAFPAIYLRMLGVQPVWYLNQGGKYERAIEQLIVDNVYADEWEIRENHDVHPSECEWQGQSGLRFDPSLIAFVWLGYERRTYPVETRAMLLRSILPPHIDVLHEPPEKVWGSSPCKGRH